MRLFDWLFGRRPIKQAAPARRRSRPAFEEQDDDDEDFLHPHEPRLPPKAEMRWPIARPEGDWRILSDFEIPGLQYHLEAAKAFILSAARNKGAGCAIALRPEPLNPHDANAIAIHVTAPGFAGKVGYVPREVAATVARCPPDMPLAAAVRKVRLGATDFAVIAVQVLMPAKRSEFWRDRKYPL